MAPKQRLETGTRPSNRIRFVMLDADLSEGNLSELTQAITSALRPAPAVPRPSALPATTSPDVNDHSYNASAATDDEISVEHERSRRQLFLPGRYQVVNSRGSRSIWRHYSPRKARLP
jgi:hypothetical protein